MGQFSVVDARSVMVLDSGATANSVCYMWSERRNSIFGRWGVRRTEASPAWARFKLGDDRFGELRCAADIPAGIAGITGRLTAVVLEADIAALLRKGGLEAPGKQLAFPRNILALRKQGVDFLL